MSVQRVQYKQYKQNRLSTLYDTDTKYYYKPTNKIRSLYDDKYLLRLQKLKLQSIDSKNERGLRPAKVIPNINSRI